MQNDWLDLSVILAEKISKKCIVPRDICTSLIIFLHLFCKYLWIQCIFFAILFNKNDREIEPVVLHTINPMNSTKWVTSFSWIFHFLLIDFSKKIIEHFFHKCLMPWGYVKLFTRSKKKKTYFGGSHGFLCRMLGLERDYCTTLEKFENQWWYRFQYFTRITYLINTIIIINFLLNYGGRHGFLLRMLGL